jgi:hypothetical protein
MGNCVSKSLGFLKDGKFDKDMAMKALNTAFAGNNEWISVAKKAVDDCVADGKFKILEN